jgi:hypothetical protein
MYQQLVIAVTDVVVQEINDSMDDDVSLFMNGHHEIENDDMSMSTAANNNNSVDGDSIDSDVSWAAMKGFRITTWLMVIGVSTMNDGVIDDWRRKGRSPMEVSEGFYLHCRWHKYHMKRHWSGIGLWNTTKRIKL